MDMKRVICVNSMFLFLFLFIWPLKIYAQCSIARKWNEVLLEAIRNDYGRPTVYARNLFHTSIAIYDAWAFYDNKADTYSLGRKVGISAFNKANNYFNGETVTCIEQYTYYDILLYPNPVTGQEINLKLIEPFDGEMISCFVQRDTRSDFHIDEPGLERGWLKNFRLYFP